MNKSGFAYRSKPTKHRNQRRARILAKKHGFSW